MSWERSKIFLQYILAILGILALAITLFYALLHYVPEFQTKKTDAITATIYLVTAIVVALYTVETRGMRLQMVRQYEIELRPLLVATVQNARELLLKNIGRSPALSIQVEPLAFEPVEDAIGNIQTRGLSIEVVANFDPTDYLEAREMKAISYSCYIKGSGGEELPIRSEKLPLLASLFPAHAKRNYCITIHYQDIDHKPHTSIMQIGKDGTKLVRYS